MRMNVLLFLCCAVTVVWGAPTFAQAEPLAGSEWRPVNINGIAIEDDAGIFLQFAADGKVQGSGGCNNFTGGYKVDGTTIAIGPIASTRMLCPEPANENESRFFAALQQSVGFQRDQTELTFVDDERKTVVELVQTDAD